MATEPDDFIPDGDVDLDWPENTGLTDQHRRAGLGAPAITGLVLIGLMGFAIGWVSLSDDNDQTNRLASGKIIAIPDAAERYEVVTAISPPPSDTSPPPQETPVEEVPQQKSAAPALSAPLPEQLASLPKPSEPIIAPVDEPAPKKPAKPAPVEIEKQPSEPAVSEPVETRPAAVKQPGMKIPGLSTPEDISLPTHADPALLDPKDGKLPIVSVDGRKSWEVYARPFADPKNRPRVAIIVGGMGLSEAATNSAIQQLPGSVTLAFSPYAKNLQRWISKARAAGHEVMLQIPMEPYDYPNNDPGPHTLLTNLSTQDNIGRLEWLMGRFSGYIGITNYMGSKFTSSAPNIRPILSAMNERGLMFLDSRASQRSAAARIAKELDLPLAINNSYIDNKAARNAIDSRLTELERLALAEGAAVGIGFSYPVTLERITKWAATLDEKGVVLAPVTALAGMQIIP